jgi:outer membrane immunogenic protein
MDHNPERLTMLMRKTFLSLLAGTASVAAFGSAALAADLPSRAPPPAPYVAVPVFTWTGFYVGVNAGGGFSSSGRDDAFGNTALVGTTPIDGLTGVSTSSRSRSGFVGGGQIGYNYQMGHWVIGIEADIQGTSFGNNRNNALFGADPNGFSTATADGVLIAAPVPGAPGNVAFFNNQFAARRNLDWFGTVRGRIGYSWDRLLVYGTGGVAFSDAGSDRAFGSFGSSAAVPAPFFTTGGLTAVTASPVVGTAVISRNSSDLGYAVGGGVEYAFTPTITGKIEGLYVNLGHSGARVAGNSVIGVTNTGAPVTASSVGFRSRDDDFGVVRAGLSYKFSLF